MKATKVVVIMWEDPVSSRLHTAVEHLDRLPLVVVQRLDVRSHKLTWDQQDVKEWNHQGQTGSCRTHMFGLEGREEIQTSVPSSNFGFVSPSPEIITW